MNNDVGFCKCLQSQYDGLTSIDEDTIYIVTDTGRIYKGSVLVGTSESGGGSSTTGTGLLAYDSFDKFISDFNSNSYVNSVDIGTSTVCTYNKYTNTLQLWKDVSLSQTITITKPLKFDLNGYSVVLTGTAGITYSGQDQLYVYSSSSRSKISTSSTTKCIYTLSDGSLKSENVDYESSFTLLDITKSFDSSHSIEFSHSNITISDDNYGIYNQPSDTNNYCTAEFGFYFCNITFSKLSTMCGLRVSGSLTLSNCNLNYETTVSGIGPESGAIFQECIGISSFLKITNCEFNGPHNISSVYCIKAIVSYSANVEISGLQYSAVRSVTNNIESNINYAIFSFDIQGTLDSSQGTVALISLNNCYINEGNLYVSNSSNEGQKYKLQILNSSITMKNGNKALTVFSSSSEDTVDLHNTCINCQDDRLSTSISLAVFNVKTRLITTIVGGNYTISSLRNSTIVFKVGTPNSLASPTITIDVSGSSITSGDGYIVSSESGLDPSKTQVNFSASNIKAIDSSRFVSPGITTNFIASSYDDSSSGYAFVASDILNSVFPINTIIPFYDSVDHSNYLGFTWERCLVGRVPVGIDSNDTDFNAIGKKVGEKSHQLTTSEAPTLAKEGVLVASGGSNLRVTDYSGDAAKSHGNIQPSEVVAFWKRVE